MAKSEDTNLEQTNNPIKNAINAQMATKAKLREERGNMNPIQAIDSTLNQKQVKKQAVAYATSEDIKSLKEMLAEYINYTKLNNTNQNKRFSELVAKVSELISLNKSTKKNTNELTPSKKPEYNNLDKTSFENFQRTFKDNDIHEIRHTLISLNKNIETFNKNSVNTNSNKAQDINSQINNDITSKHFEDIKSILTALSDKVSKLSIPELNENTIKTLTETVKKDKNTEFNVSISADSFNNILERNFEQFLNITTEKTTDILNALDKQHNAVTAYFDKIINQYEIKENTRFEQFNKKIDNLSVNYSFPASINFNFNMQQLEQIANVVKNHEVLTDVSENLIQFTNKLRSKFRKF